MTGSKIKEIVKGKPFDGFWKRLEMFVKEVQVNDPMSYEEKEMILNICQQQLKQQQP